MSGHSKWSKIKRKKGSADAARGRLFSKLIKAITIAARHGGGDPDSNARLRTAIDEAKSNNMPWDNIERAIKRGTGKMEGQTLEEVTYEAYGPSGVAILIEVVTDNRNRATSEIKHVLARQNGSLGTAGSVAWQFQAQGIISVDVKKYDEDSIIAYALEGGATDVKTEEGTYQIITSSENYTKVKEILQNNKIEILSSELTKIPQNTIPLADKEAEKILKLYEALDALDDVQHVYANFDISEDVMEKISSEAG
ncbi:transcriptional regulator [candidate division WOR_3 bacterium SM23_42]|uniref:Probable transcriptional regulatory protein AMJ83_02625 n=1 Tax=candidate division WOR_3 bacterium SM23_42 TaxID=1703779 RepID=A0A0S8FX92_UNCW3|nr:MAG: transcriptional regulator [candidate division WOR_3 bacterium SM23_42]